MKSQFISPKYRHRALWSYLFALAAFLVMFGLRYAADGVLEERLPFMFFMLSAMAAAWYGGLGPGVVAWVLGLLAGDYFFMAPLGEVGLHQPGDYIQIAIYTVPTFFAVLLLEILHRTTRNLELSGARLESELAERRKAEEALRQAQHELSRHALLLEEHVAQRTAQLVETIHSLETFSYTVAHNLRAPLRALQGISQATLEDYGSALDETGRDYLHRIQQSAVRMDSLICDLVGYDNLSRQSWQLEPVPLDRVIEQSITTLQDEIEARDALVQRPPESPAVLAHEETLAQILTHLLENALKFAAPGKKPVLEITTEERNGFVRIAVRDHGIGVAPEHHERIFGLFERLHGPEYPGNGMGLALVRMGAQRMGGKAGVDSTPGQGSTFWLDLQKAEEPVFEHRDSPAEPLPVAAAAALDKALRFDGSH